MTGHILCSSCTSYKCLAPVQQMEQRVPRFFFVLNSFSQSPQPCQTPEVKSTNSKPPAVSSRGRPNWPGWSSWPIWTQSKPKSNNFTKPFSLLRPPSIYPTAAASHTVTAVSPNPASASLPPALHLPLPPADFSPLNWFNANFNPVDWDTNLLAVQIVIPQNED